MIFSGLLVGLWGILALFIILFIVLFTFLPIWRMRGYKKEGVIDSFFPVFGTFKSMVKDLQEKNDCMASSKEFSKEHPDAKVFVTNFKSQPLVLLRDTQYIKEFLLNPQNYEKSSTAKALLPLMGTGLLLAEGETWKHHRKVISNVFHNEFFKSHTQVIQAITRESLDGISPEHYQGFKAINKMQEITGEIVGRLFFGKDLSKYTFENKSLTLALAGLIAEMTSQSKEPLSLFLGTGVMKMSMFPTYVNTQRRAREYRDVCMKIIKDRKDQSSDEKDLLSSLLAIQGSANSEQTFTDEDIVNAFINFFAAGMDTTGHLIGMTLYGIAQHPDYVEELKRERDSTYNKDKALTLDTLQSMDTVHALLKETMRFYTPLPALITRVATKNHKLIDLDIKKGDLVRPEFISPFFNEKFFENPQQFDLNRWKNFDAKIDPYVFIPFSAGPRSCIGQHLAIVEAKIIVSEFLERFKFVLSKDFTLQMTSRSLYEPIDDILLDLSLINV